MRRNTAEQCRIAGRRRYRTGIETLTLCECFYSVFLFSKNKIQKFNTFREHTKSLQYQMMELVIAVCGGDKVGKSSIIKSFFGQDYMPDHDVQYKYIGSKDLVHIYVEKFRSSLSNPDGCIFVYDITSSDSFSTMCDKYRDVGRMFRQNIIVFGNKTDLDITRRISQIEVDDWTRQKGLKHLVGNSYEKSTIDEAFYQLIQDIILGTGDQSLADRFRNFVTRTRC